MKCGVVKEDVYEDYAKHVVALPKSGDYKDKYCYCKANEMFYRVSFYNMFVIGKTGRYACDNGEMVTLNQDFIIDEKSRPIGQSKIYSVEKQFGRAICGTISVDIYKQKLISDQKIDDENAEVYCKCPNSGSSYRVGRLKPISRPIECLEEYPINLESKFYKSRCGSVNKVFPNQKDVSGRGGRCICPNGEIFEIGFIENQVEKLACENAG